ncbi:hypothetical protein PLESTM_000073500 [Pleodorina starrii]|nr:hypothetical protein PLESTM_000073500 [Pleodorina starrii]
MYRRGSMTSIQPRNNENRFEKRQVIFRRDSSQRLLEGGHQMREERGAAQAAPSYRAPSFPLPSLASAPLPPCQFVTTVSVVSVRFVSLTLPSEAVGAVLAVPGTAGANPSAAQLHLRREQLQMLPHLAARRGLGALGDEICNANAAAAQRQRRATPTPPTRSGEIAYSLMYE